MTRPAPSPDPVRRAAWPGRLARCRAGNVTVELAVLSIPLTLLIIGAVDFGRYGIEVSRLAGAARAGAQYGIQNQAAAQDPDSVAIAAANDGGPTVEATARFYCACPGSGGEIDCLTGSCGAGGAQYTAMYVEVTVSKELEMFFDYPGLSNPAALSVTRTIRAR